MHNLIHTLENSELFNHRFFISQHTCRVLSFLFTCQFDCIDENAGKERQRNHTGTVHKEEHCRRKMKIKVFVKYTQQE